MERERLNRVSVIVMCALYDIIVLVYNIWKTEFLFILNSIILYLYSIELYLKFKTHNIL